MITRQQDNKTARQQDEKLKLESMMKLQILGGGCAKCKTLEANALKAVESMKIQAEIVKVTDMDEILDMGVMVTPAFAIDGDVKTTGKVLTPEQIIDILSADD